MSERPIRVAFLITGLQTGGAELMLLRLLKRLSSDFEVTVISLTSGGDLAGTFRIAGHTLVELGIAKSPKGILRVATLPRLLKNLRVDLLQTWMYHADLVGIFAGKLQHIPVVWNIRHGTLSKKENKFARLLVVRLCARFSKLPKQIVAVSEHAKRIHEHAGYEGSRIVVIPNGYETERFRPNSAAKISLRSELRISEAAFLVGLVGRFDPIKDHKTFIGAAAQVAHEFPNARFLLCGNGISWSNPGLAGPIEQTGLRDRFYLAGRRDDMPRVMAALDLLVSSSNGEGFANVIPEAMSAGIPCVVTDVGDSASVVGDTGVVVPPRNPEQLAGAIARVLRMSHEERQELGRKARERIENNYSMERVVAAYSALYKSVVQEIRKSPKS